MDGRVLVVDDDVDLCKLLEARLQHAGARASYLTSATDALAALERETFDVVVTDINMPGMTGVELCERIVANRPDIPVVIITTHANLETATAAIRAGAYDYITKPIQFDTLELTVARALQKSRLVGEVKQLKQVVSASREFGNIIGGSPAMRSVFDVIDCVADSDSSVLVTGESGTGKELVARALHERGRRRGGPFVAINCAAMPEPLLESELFGHAKGAFTDARTARSGLFVQASGGTLLLDEIGDMPMQLQVKLLRALQERAVRPVGGDAEVPFDVRLISATNRDLETAIDEGRFRQDLFYRIDVVHVELPPLRARGNDVLLLAQHFVERFAGAAGKRITGFTPQTAEKLLTYAWPGNVRELQNAIERAIALTRYEELAVDDLPDKIRSYQSSHVVVASNNPEELVSMEEVEKRYVLRVLDAVGGNKALAARTLGFDRKTLYRKLERYGVTID